MGKKTLKLIISYKIWLLIKKADLSPECSVSVKLICKASGIYSILLTQRRWLAALYSEKAPFVSSWGIAE